MNMAITLTDEHGNEIDLSKADGGTLRKKLEEALAENRKLSEQVATSAANEVIREHGYKLVKPEDLAGVPVDQMKAKAEELQKAAEAARQDAIRSVLEERGLGPEAIDKMVEELVGDGGGEPTREPDPFAGLEDLGGEPPARTPKLPPITDAMGNLESHFSNQRKK